MNATERFETIARHAETIRHDGDHDMRTLEVCDEWRQGDVRVRRLHDDADKALAGKLEPIKDFGGQVAPGTTMGSRHVLDSLDGVTAYRIKNASAIDGPVVRLDKPRTLTHPEHGNCVNMPAGWYAFPGQRVYAEELRRVMD